MSLQAGVRVSRRGFIKVTAAALATGPFFSFPSWARAGKQSLRIAKWAHFVPQYDAWFDQMARDWGAHHEMDVTIDTIAPEDVWSRAQAETKSESGHDIFMFPWPPAEFQRHAEDHTGIYDKVSFLYGSIPQIAHKSTFNPTSKKHFAFADFWIPSPLHYFEDLWAEADMPLGPVHYGSLKSGGKRVRSKMGIPCGLAFTPTLEGNITSNTLFYAFRGQIVDDAGGVNLNENAFTVEAIKYVKALNQEAGTPDEIAWTPLGNVRAMLARKISCTSNAISLLRSAEQESGDLAEKIRLQPPLLGPYGVTAFPHATNCSVIWKFAKNKEEAQQFLVDLVGESRAGYDASRACNFPTYPKTIPNLIVRLENDSRANPPHKYSQLKDALHWTPNLGAPGFASPAWMETFNTFVIQKMFARAVKGELSPLDAARAAQAEVRQIAEKWKEV